MTTYKNICIKDQRAKNGVVFSNDTVGDYGIDKYILPTGDNNNSGDDTSNAWKDMDGAINWLNTTDFTPDHSSINIILPTSDTASQVIDMTKMFSVNKDIQVTIMSDGVYPHYPVIMCKNDTAYFNIQMGLVYIMGVNIEDDTGVILDYLFYVNFSTLITYDCTIDIDCMFVQSESGSHIELESTTITSNDSLMRVINSYVYLDDITYTGGMIGIADSNSYVYIKPSTFNGRQLIISHGSVLKGVFAMDGTGYSGDGVIVNYGSTAIINSSTISNCLNNLYVTDNSYAHINGGTYSNAGNTCFTAENGSHIIAKTHSYSGNTTNASPAGFNATTPSYGNTLSWIYDDTVAAS